MFCYGMKHFKYRKTIFNMKANCPMNAMDAFIFKMAPTKSKMADQQCIFWHFVRHNIINYDT